MTSPLLLASNVFLAWQIGVNYHRFSSGCDLHKISKPPHAIEIHLTDLWLLGEESKPIIICDADKAFLFVRRVPLSNLCTRIAHCSFF